MKGGKHYQLYRNKYYQNNKILLYSTGNYIQYPVISHNEKEKKLFKKVIINKLDKLYKMDKFQKNKC